MVRRVPTSCWWLTAAAVALAAGPALGQAPRVVQCERCHANREFLVGKTPAPEQDSALYVPASTLRDTRHRNLRCEDCHRGFEAGYPHRVTAVVAPCQTCHAATGRDWEAYCRSVRWRIVPGLY